MVSDKDLVKMFISPSFVSDDMKNENGNGRFIVETKDNVVFENYNEAQIRKDTQVKKEVYSSDYAVLSGARYIPENLQNTKSKSISTHWLTTRLYHEYVGTYGADGKLGAYTPSFKSLGMRPCLNLNLEPVVKMNSFGYHKFDTKPVQDFDGHVLYNIMEFGKYPQTRAKNGELLEDLYRNGHLPMTGKKYLGRMDKAGDIIWNFEYEYDGKNYVRLISNRFSEYSRLKDGSRAPQKGEPVWVEVKPIKWIIRNWDDLPKSINPNGNGTAKTINLMATESIASGLPYYPARKDKVHAMWQNSFPRAYFNGYNIHKTLNKGNGNEAFKADINFNFEDDGFIKDALMQDMKSTYKLLNRKREINAANEK